MPSQQYVNLIILTYRKCSFYPDSQELRTALHSKYRQPDKFKIKEDGDQTVKECDKEI